MASNPPNNPANMMPTPLPQPHQMVAPPNTAIPPNTTIPPPPMQPPTGQPPPGFVPLTPHGTLPLPPPPTAHHQSIPPPPDMQSLMDKTAQKTVQSQNAFEFEELIRRKQASNPQFAFLFRGHPWNHYYEWKKVTLQQIQQNNNNNNNNINDTSKPSTSDKKENNKTDPSTDDSNINDNNVKISIHITKLHAVQG